MDDTRSGLTLGERTVGVDFNPSGDEVVGILKKLFAEAIDILDCMRMGSGERGRAASIAITEAEGACMWAVKAATRRG